MASSRSASVVLTWLSAAAYSLTNARGRADNFSVSPSFLGTHVTGQYLLLCPFDRRTAAEGSLTRTATARRAGARSREGCWRKGQNCSVGFHYAWLEEAFRCRTRMARPKNDGERPLARNPKRRQSCPHVDPQHDCPEGHEGQRNISAQQLLKAALSQKCLRQLGVLTPSLLRDPHQSGVRRADLMLLRRRRIVHRRPACFGWPGP